MKYNLYSKQKMFLINMEDSSYIEFPYIYVYILKFSIEYIIDDVTPLSLPSMN